MKIFIGTPIRDTKEYSVYEWLDSIRELNYPSFLYMVDNSDMSDFSIKVKEYCKKIGLINYEMNHLDKMIGRENEYRLVYSRESIRNKMLAGNYDYWLSWECDIVLPSNTLGVLFPYTKTFDVINHCYPDKDDKLQEVGGVGCSLFKRELLEKFSFLEGGGYAMCDKDKPNCYYSGDSWFCVRVLRAKYKVVDLHNLLEIKHIGEGIN